MADARLLDTRVFLVITPGRDIKFPPGTTERRMLCAREIATVLGIAPEDILNTSAAMPGPLFSSDTHLNRWGQQMFTAILARTTAERGR